MKATFTRTALALATVFTLAVSAVAQTPAESLFDSIENGNTARSAAVAPQNLSTPSQFENAPNFDPRFQIQMAPQAFVQQAVPIQQSVPDISGPAPNYAQPEQFVLPPTCERLPKLQFSGRLIPGVGMQVVAVDYGGVAQSVGLKPGDIIVTIDGRLIRTVWDYETVLFNAAVYYEGHVDLVVRNIRYRPGCSLNPEYLSIHADLPTRCLIPAVASR